MRGETPDVYSVWPADCPNLGVKYAISDGCLATNLADAI
jgi:hypothetical protein